MEFLSFLRALSLEPADDSVIKKLVDTVLFQGNRINITELGPDLTQAITRLLSEDQMDYEDIDGVEIRNGNEIALFGNIKLPDVNTTPYLLRRLEHGVMIITKNNSTRWDALERELTRRMHEVNENENCKGQEIFAISWATPSNGGGNVKCLQNVQEDKETTTSSDDEDNELLKVSDLLKWKTRQDCNSQYYAQEEKDCNYSVEDDDVYEDYAIIEKRKEEENRKREKLHKNMELFLSWSAQPPGKCKLRLIELDEFENPDVQFDSLCQVAKTKCFTVHWLQAFSKGGFIWRKTFGPLKLSRLKLNVFSYPEEKWLEYLEYKPWQNVICISGVSGMGKTTLLANMAHALKQKYKNRLVCWINLKELGDLIDALGTKSLNIIDFVHLLYDYFDVRDIEKSILTVLVTALEADRTKDAENLLRMKLKVEFLMDGLDAMSEKTRKILVSFFLDELDLSDKWSYRIWLTTRPHLKHEIEDAFSIVAYELEPMNRNDLEVLLQHEMKKTNKANKNVHSLPQLVFSTSLKACLKIDLGSLLNTPNRMIDFLQYYLNNSCPNLFQLHAYKIMKNVIMKNAKSYYIRNNLCFKKKDHSESNDEILEKVIKMHIPLAIRVCSGENGSPTDAVDLAGLNLEEEAFLLDFGIVTKNKEGKVFFVHEAYPAYLLAEYYRNSPPDFSVASDFFLNYVLVKDACDLIRQFYEESLEDGMLDVILVEWMILIRNFLIKNYFLSNDLYHHDKTQSSTNVMQLAIIDQRPKMAKLMLWSFCPSHRRECRRLIRRKVLVEITDTRKNNKRLLQDKGNKKSTTTKNCNGTKFAKVDNAQQKRHVELSALSLAIMLGDSELAKSMYLILGENRERQNPHMTKFSIQDDFHFTPFHLAVIGCNPKTFDYLRICLKASINTFDAGGHLPMHLLFFNRWILCFPSTKLGSPEVDSDILREVHICKYYEDQLDPDWNDRVGEVADRAGHLPLLSSRMVMSYTKMQMKNCHNFSIKRINQPWKICYYRSYREYLKLADILTGKTKINACNKVPAEWNRVPPPFHLACAAGYIPMIEVMLKKGAKLNIKDKHNRTALYGALCKEQMHVVQYLVEKGIDRKVSKEINNIPLLHHLSVQNSKKAVAYVVDELNVPVDLRANEDMDNCTPLHMACIGGCLETVQTLIELGASVNAEDNEKYTPLLHAVHPTANCNLKLVKFLLTQGADVNAVVEGKEGVTCLHEAVASKNLPLIQCLLRHAKDIDVNKVTSTGQSPLHWACKQKENKEILEVLVKAGSVVDLLDNDGRTPLFVFCLENHADVDMGLYLIEQGASVFQIDTTGQSLLRQLNKKNPELGKLLYTEWKKLLERNSNEERDKMKKVKMELSNLKGKRRK